MSTLWILGEAKSGKSELAEEIFARLPGKKFYIGTLPRIPRWMDTIKKHVDKRPEDWKLIEVTDKMWQQNQSGRVARTRWPLFFWMDGEFTQHAGLLNGAKRIQS